MANNPNAIDNLKSALPGEVRNPNGRPVGVPNRKTILNFLLFEADINDMEVIKNKPSWYDKVKPKTIYEMMTLAMAIKAMGGDAAAFNALNNALGIDVNATSHVDVVHIFVPEKLSIDELNIEGARILEQTRKVVDSETSNERVEIPIRTTDISITNP